MEIMRTSKGTETFTTPYLCKSAEIIYLCTGVTSRDEAISAVYSARPLIYNYLYYSEIRVSEYINDSTLEVTVVYSQSGTESGDTEAEATVQYSSGGGSTRITHAKSQRILKGDDIGAGTMIGWNGLYGDKMELTGVDIASASIFKSYTIYKKRSSLTTTYEKKVNQLRNCVNSKGFKGYDEGEVLFLNMTYSGEDSSSSVIAVTFNFMIQHNETNATWDGVSVGAVEGHEYVHCTTLEDGSETVFAARVYSKADLNNLGV